MIFGSHRLLRPSWIISHIIVLALLVSTVNLGFWQLRRLEERKSNNAQIIDYANSDFRSDFMDFYLGYKSSFCVTTATGMDSFSFYFRKKLEGKNFEITNLDLP